MLLPYRWILGCLGAILLIGVFATIFIWIHPRVHTITFSSDGEIAYTSEEAYWTARIAAVGGKSAYQEFAASVAQGLTPRIQHVAAHVFGESLYRVEGLSGAAVCDTRFDMGCMHALFGTAAVDLGIGTLIHRIALTCTQGPIGLQRLCLHGVGHGMLGSLGYTVADLKESLSLCETIPTAGNLTTGCWGGALMEYNVRSLISLDAPPRALTKESAYSPCDALPQKYVAACMFWQPTWWHIILTHTEDNIHAFADIGALCEQHAESISCLQGAGFRSAWTTGYNAPQMADLCAAISSKAESRLACWSSAATELRPEAVVLVQSRVCTGLTDTQRAVCEEGLRR